MSKNKKSEAADKMELVDELVPGSSYQAKGEIINPLEQDEEVIVFYFKRSKRDAMSVQFFKGTVPLNLITEVRTVATEDLAIASIHHLSDEILDTIFNSKGIEV